MALSKGRERKDAKNPATALAKSRLYLESFLVSPFNQWFNLSLASSYGPSIPKFKTTALITVGTQPLQRLKNPSSFTIRLNAFNILNYICHTFIVSSFFFWKWWVTLHSNEYKIRRSSYYRSYKSSSTWTYTFLKEI